MERKPHSYNSGRIHRAAGTQNATAPQSTAPRQNLDDVYLPQAGPLRRKRRWPVVVLVVILILAFVAGGLLMAGYFFADSLLDSGLLGVLGGGNTPKEYRGDLAHILIIGIDNEEGRNYGAGLGLTDMILYARFDMKNNQLNLLQIPRDSYVGEDLDTGGSGKINALLMHGPDKDNPINNLANVIQEQFRLPVDYYVALDMDALRNIVDAFGGLRVYVPRTMDYDGGHLDAGWQWLDGISAEFFVRTRHGTGFERGDIDRLDNQRHFYSALFRRFLNLSPGDVVKLLPVIKEYCSTDIGVDDLVGLGVSALKLNAENVLFGKVPGATGDLDPSGRGRSLYFVDLYGRGQTVDEEGNLGENPGLAAILNRYFRKEGDAVEASELGLPQIEIPESVALYPPNIQGMGDVQQPEGGGDVDVEPS